jgi:hypothetical protein
MVGQHQADDRNDGSAFVGGTVTATMKTEMEWKVKFREISFSWRIATMAKHECVEYTRRRTLTSLQVVVGHVI